jgi:hypothetical protein
VGTFVWEASDGRTSVAAIVRGVCDTFDVTPPRAEHDVQAFVEQLAGLGLLTVTEEPAA